MKKKDDNNSEIFNDDNENIGSEFNFEESASAFENTSTEESNMFSDDTPAPTSNKKKNKALPFIIVGLVIVMLVAAVFTLPILFVNLGDASIKEGDFEKAASYYKLCFGTNDSTKRLNAANATALIKKGKTEEGITLLLDSGIKVNVNYDLNGGSFINSNRKTSVTLQDKTEFGDLYKARKDYYSFDYWALSQYSYAPDFDDSVFNVSLKAIFSLNNYKISYTNLFSDKVENPVEYNYETSTITLKAPSRVGYTFLYWKGTDINGEATTVIIPQGSHGDRAYIANWAPNKYTVTMNPDVECKIDNPITVTYDDDYELPAIEKRGYTHKGWSDGKKTYFNGVWNTLSDVTLEPVWDINKYTLTYDLAGGKTEKANPSSYTVVSEDITLVEPTKFGYTFTGWYRSDKKSTEKNIVIKKNSIGSIDFKAVWKGNPHKLSLNAGGGTVSPSTVNVVFGNEYTIPNPTRKGYTFTGWYSGNTKYTSGVWNQDNDVSLTASWTANKYKVSLNANGGSSSSSSLTATFDTSYSLPTPTRYGYTFTGWYNGNTKFASSGTWSTVSDVTLKAGWQGNPHVVTLNANGGNVSSSSVKVVVGNNYKIPTPTKKGYTFTGWYNGSSKHPETGVWDKDNDVSLVANWSLNTYEAKLDVNGGSTSKTSVSCQYGKSYTLPTPTRKGYTFNGWYDASAKIPMDGTWIWDSNLYLMALWTANKYTISFDANYGKLSSNNTLVVTYDSPYKLPVPTKTGHEFLGWYDGYTKYTDGVWKLEKNLYLEAEWQIATYTAYLDVNGGKTSKSSISTKYDERYQLPTPTRTGYTFDGWWSYWGELPLDDYWIWDEDLDLTAKWTPNEYTVSFSANGGTLSTKNISVKFDQKYELPIPERTGYTFLGWYKGSTKVGNSGNKWTIADNVSLSAKWELKNYSVRLDANGGRVSPTTLTISYNSYYSIPDPTRTGYTFKGWYYNGTRFNSSGTWSFDDNVVLKAEWEGNTYTATLNADGGSVSSNSITLVYGSSYVLPIPEKKGYKFAGWYNGASKVSESGIWSTSNNISLIAKWTLQTYSVSFNANGGSVSKTSMLVTYNSAYSLPTPARTGYTFDGWYYNGTRFNSSGTWSFDDNVVLKAEWEGIDYTVYLDANGGNCVSSINVTYGETYVLPIPTRNGHVFEGWYNGNTKMSNSGTWKSTQSYLTLTAKWSVIETPTEVSE